MRASDMATDSTLVSVVIPVHNGARFINKTLASALSQTHRLLELIVVDDGSTDETTRIVEMVAAGDDRIRAFRIDKSGVAAARNFGVRQARGEFIATLDADDLWHPEKIARQVSVMRDSSPDVGLVYCWCIGIDENDFIIRSVKPGTIKSIAQGCVTEQLAINCFIETGSSPLMRRSLVEAVGGYDAALHPQGADDWKLYLALSEVCLFAVIPQYLVGYRQVSGSVTRNLESMTQSMLNVAQWIFTKRPDLPEGLRDKSVYGIYCFMARRALENSQFSAAARYRAKALRAYPKGLFDKATPDFAARFLARAMGIRRSDLKMLGMVAPQVSFEDFCAC